MHRASIRRSRRGVGGVATAFVLALFVAIPFFAAPPKRGSTSAAARREGAARGRVTYQIYCRSCHGDHGRGDGKAAAVLTPPPTDLTALARRNGGEFPRERVSRVLEGGEDVAGHGSRDMPVWGDVFGSSEGQGKAAVRAKIQDLVDYLETIQR